MLAVLLLQTSQTATNPAVAYFTLLAAVVAAGASFYSTITASKTAKEAAKIAAETALEIKSREFKNEYYKKVLDKRIKAIENAERLTTSFINYRKNNEGAKYYSFFRKQGYDTAFKDIVDSITMNAVWYTKNMFDAVTAMNAEVGPFIVKLQQADDDAAKVSLGVAHFDSIRTHVRKIMVLISQEIQTMHDVDGFLKARLISGEAPSLK